MLGVIGCAVAWHIGQRALLQVTAATGIPSCVRTTLTEYESDPNSGYVESGIPLRRGAECTVTVQVTNRSEQSIELGRVTVPVSGPEARGGWEIRMIGGLKTFSGEFDLDATVDLDWTLDPGDSQVIDFRVITREDGCFGASVLGWVEPTIHLSRLLGERDLIVADFPFFRGTHATYSPTSCDT